MEEVTLEGVVVQGVTINVMYDDYGTEFGDQASLDSYVNELSFRPDLKDMFLKLIYAQGENAIVGKTLVFNPDAIDGVIVRLV
jgi:hypothetical protein